MALHPVIALVGRPNVGKSTLFNRLTRSRDALVADQPGLTRDRKYGRVEHEGRVFIAVDTGGLTGADGGLEGLMAQHAMLAVQESDRVLFLVDGRGGLTAGDQMIAEQLRRTGKPVTLVANKMEGLDSDLYSAEFHTLGLGEAMPIASAHGQGVPDLLHFVLGALAEPAPEQVENDDMGIKVAVLGRPNVGKSTLVNRMLGEERVLVFDMPGTTRDSIYVPFTRDKQRYTLIDTAGVRRRGKVHEAIEKFSVIKALQAIEEANVAIMVLDAQAGISDQDAHLLGFILEAGRALVMVVNKWDGLERDVRERVRAELDRKLPFVDFAEVRTISALHGTGVGDLFGCVNQAYAAAMRKLPTPQITRALQDAITQHQPPLVRGRRIKLRYAHQGGSNPPLIIIHGSQAEATPENYRRFLINQFRTRLKLQGTPLRVEFRSSANPFEGRKNTLTPRQSEKRKRLMRHVKGKH